MSCFPADCSGPVIGTSGALDRQADREGGAGQPHFGLSGGDLSAGKSQHKSNNTQKGGGAFPLRWSAEPTWHGGGGASRQHWRIHSIAMLLWLGLAARAALLVLAEWQDRHLQVKFTDIDYEVYTGWKRGRGRTKELGSSPAGLQITSLFRLQMRLRSCGRGSRLTSDPRIATHPCWPSSSRPTSR